MPKIKNWHKYKGSSFDKASISNQAMSVWEHDEADSLHVQIMPRTRRKKSMGGPTTYTVQVRGFTRGPKDISKHDNKEDARKSAVDWMKKNPVETRRDLERIFE